MKSEPSFEFQEFSVTTSIFREKDPEIHWELHYRLGDWPLMRDYSGESLSPTAAIVFAGHLGINVHFWRGIRLARMMLVGESELSQLEERIISDAVEIAEMHGAYDGVVGP